MGLYKLGAAEAAGTCWQPRASAKPPISVSLLSIDAQQVEVPQTLSDRSPTPRGLKTFLVTVAWRPTIENADPQ